MICLNGQEMNLLVELRTIDETNFEACMRLHTHVDHESFVDTVASSLAEAWVYYKHTKPFAIYKDDEPIGFVSMYVGEENFQIISFFIDDHFQKRGFGTQAAKICIHFLQSEFGAARVSVPVEVRHIDAQRFWSKLGFSASDTIEDGYVFMRLDLP